MEIERDVKYARNEGFLPRRLLRDKERGELFIQV